MKMEMWQKGRILNVWQQVRCDKYKLSLLFKRNLKIIVSLFWEISKTKWNLEGYLQKDRKKVFLSFVGIFIVCKNCSWSFVLVRFLLKSLPIILGFESWLYLFVYIWTRNGEILVRVLTKLIYKWTFNCNGWILHGN